MNNTNTPIPVWYWIVSGIALLWNLMGLFAYYAQNTMTSEVLAALPEAERTLYENFPLWANVAFFLAVVGGTLGCIGLLMRKKWAYFALLLSLLGVVVQMSYNIFLSGAMEVYGPGQIAMSFMIPIVGILLLLLAKKGIANHWLS